MRAKPTVVVLKDELVAEGKLTLSYGAFDGSEAALRSTRPQLTFVVPFLPDPPVQDSIDVLMTAMAACSLELPIELVGDARSIFDAIKAPDVCDPAESSLKLHLISVRSRLESGLIRTLWWCGTRDMLADALTKGGIDRALIIRAMDKGKLNVTHDALSCVRTGRQL